MTVSKLWQHGAKNTRRSSVEQQRVSSKQKGDFLQAEKGNGWNEVRD